MPDPIIELSRSVETLSLNQLEYLEKYIKIIRERKIEQRAEQQVMDMALWSHRQLINKN